VDQILDFFTSKSVAEMAADPRVLFGTAVVFVLAVRFRWNTFSSSCSRSARR